MRVVVEGDELKKIGTNLISSAEDLQTEGKRILYLLDELEQEWQGQDINAYSSIMREKILVNLTKLSDAVDKYGNYLHAVDRVYSRLDTHYGDRIRK